MKAKVFAFCLFTGLALASFSSTATAGSFWGDDFRWGYIMIDWETGEEYDENCKPGQAECYYVEI